MWKLIGYILIGYVLYRFLTGFLIPVFRTGKQIKSKFNEMQDRMQQQMDQQQNAFSQGGNNSADKTPAGDYIDFEEVK